MATNEPDRLAAMQEALSALSKVVTKDAHEAIQDLRAAIKEAREVREQIAVELASAARLTVDTWLKPALESHMARNEASLHDALHVMAKQMAVQVNLELTETLHELRKVRSTFDSKSSNAS